jgi:hypothetical protein
MKVEVVVVDIVLILDSPTGEDVGLYIGYSEGFWTVDFVKG